MNKGFTCECGKEEKFSAYVYANTREVLLFTCEACQAKYTIVMLHATLKKHGKTWKSPSKRKEKGEKSQAMNPIHVLVRLFSGYGLG